MPFFSDKASEHKQKKQKFWQKIIMFVGSASFLGTAIIPMVTGLSKPKTAPVAQTAQEDPKVQLKKQEADFLTVLGREPNNPNALQGLVKTRLELGDLAGAEKPLKQLVVMFPQEKVLKDLLAQVEDKLGKTTATPDKATSDKASSTKPTTDSKATPDKASSPEPKSDAKTATP